jgi:very-short-patch-repair endonuclease
VDADRRVAETAAEHHAVIGREEAVACGMAGTTLSRRVEEGRLERLHPGVYGIAGVPVSWTRLLFAACVAAGRGGTASHRAAGLLWGLLEGEQPLEVSVPVNRAPRLHNVAVHRSTDLVPEHITRRRGIPVTKPLRTMVDLGAVLGPEEVEAALDRGLVARRFTVADVESFLDQLARSGRSGCGVLRRVLDDRALGDERPDGLLEPRMARLLRDASLPPAEFQHRVRDADGRLIARVDFAYPAHRLAIEVDGWSVHASPRAHQADLERQNALVAAGWTVLRFTWHDVVRRPTWVARVLREFLAR